jgi:protein-S-isoprenylcysteine O-methyltransferase Ste14
MDLLVQIGIITMKKRNPNEPYLSKTIPYKFSNHFVYLCWRTAGIFD